MIVDMDLNAKEFKEFAKQLLVYVAIGTITGVAAGLILISTFKLLE